MKLRYLFTALLFTGAAAPLQAQSIDHMRKLLQEIQQEIDCLEKEQAETLKPRKEPQPVESTEYVDGVIAVDTLPSGNDAVMIVLFNDNTWKYLRNRDYVKDSEIYTRCWDTTKLFPYRDVVKLADLPRSVDIELVDSLKCYHYPYKAAIRSKFGMRRLRLSCRSSTSKNTRSSSDNICWATPDTLSGSRLSIPTPNPVK